MFCLFLQGAERKTRDEERRAAKRKMTATGRKKLDELYHPVTDRSEFYSMQDMNKPPVLFTPSEDIDKLSSMDLQGFYGHDPDGLGADVKSSPFLLHATQKPATPTLKFHNHFPPDVPTWVKIDIDMQKKCNSNLFETCHSPLRTPYWNDLYPFAFPCSEKKDHILEQAMVQNSMEFGQPVIKRQRMTPPLSERVMLYVRQDNEDVYTPLHVVPPTTMGLLQAVSLDR